MVGDLAIARQRDAAAATPSPSGPLASSTISNEHVSPVRTADRTEM
jgi:hypothetical protein